MKLVLFALSISLFSTRISNSLPCMQCFILKRMNCVLVRFRMNDLLQNISLLNLYFLRLVFGVSLHPALYSVLTYHKHTLSFCLVLDAVYHLHTKWNVMEQEQSLEEFST
jgi:hypothetical protein